jgi:hypothetical protein
MGTRIIVALGVAAALVIGATSVQAQTAKWDQAKVSAIADQLAASVADLRDQVRKQPPVDSPPQRKARYQVLQDLKMIESTSKQLAADLRGGEGREETQPAYDRLQMLRRDAAEHARSSDIREPVLGRVVATKDLLAQIAPYYEVTSVQAPAPPTLVQ